jgi:hypothetical protein
MPWASHERSWRVSSAELLAVASAPAPDPLIVHAGWSMLVTTDALLAHLPELAQLADAVEGDAHRIALLGLETPPGALRLALERCETGGIALADAIRRLRFAIAASEASYELGERAIRHLQDVESDAFAAVLGRFVPAVAVGGLLAWKLAPGDDAQKKAALQHFMLEHPELITSPAFSTLVRRIVSGVDDAALGLAGAPPWVGLLLGEHGLGILGVGTSAGVLIAAGGASGTGYFSETPVRVERVSERRMGSAPEGAADRLARVPDAQQVRIERYEAPGEPPRYVVYVAPTQTFSPLADEEPWDLTSNVAGVAGLPAGSIRATELAMADAGITSGDEVVLVGFSQGGLVADAIAASGQWNTVGLETYGDPGGGIELPEGIRGVAVRHSDDFVVATGGAQGPTDRTIVERRAYPEGAQLPTDKPAPAHQRRAYEDTARMLDGARSPEVRAELDALDAFTREYAERDGSRMTTFSYHAERVPAG